MTPLLIDFGTSLNTTITIVLIITTVLAATIYLWHRVATTVDKIRKDARLAEKERNDEKEAQIRVAVEAERSRWMDHREDESERIKRLRELSEEWKAIAQQKDVRYKLQADELVKVHDQLSDLRTKYEQLVILYTNSQTRLVALEDMNKVMLSGASQI